MKSIKELKEEQYDLKAKLHEIIELINSEQYYELSDGEKALINQQRVGMELYLSCLTKRVYGSPEATDTSNLLWLTMLYGMFNTSSGFGTSSNIDYLKKELDKTELKESNTEENESGCSN